MRYIVQVDNHGIPKTDLCFELIEACRYQNWYYGAEIHSIVLCDIEQGIYRQITGKASIDDVIIPVGTIDFVEKLIGRELSVLNIPEELHTARYTCRNIIYANRDQIVDMILENEYDELFVKSNTRPKGYTNVINKNNMSELVDDTYMVSEVLDMRTEWRVFVHSSEILDCRRYSGDMGGRIDVELIKNFVKEYKNCPPAYTLDVGETNDNRIVVIEAHNFISCGLYGFKTYDRLPQMVSAAINYELKLKEQHNEEVS